MQTLTASEARANLYRLMDRAAESHQGQRPAHGVALQVTGLSTPLSAPAP